jgi:hypothetical protein
MRILFLDKTREAAFRTFDYDEIETYRTPTWEGHMQSLGR